jgi:hypothetical protein
VKETNGRPMCRLEDNIKMDLQEMRWGTWSGLLWLRVGPVAGSCECGNVPSSSKKCAELDYLLTC